jgi:hypothetical protein
MMSNADEKKIENSYICALSNIDIVSDEFLKSEVFQDGNMSKVTIMLRLAHRRYNKWYRCVEKAFYKQKQQVAACYQYVAQRRLEIIELEKRSMDMLTALFHNVDHLNGIKEMFTTIQQMRIEFFKDTRLMLMNENQRLEDGRRTYEMQWIQFRELEHSLLEVNPCQARNVTIYSKQVEMMTGYVVNFDNNILMRVRYEVDSFLYNMKCYSREYMNIG